MRIAAKFTLAFIAGIVLVHVTSAAIRVRREIDLFQRDVARDALILGRGLSHAVESVWATTGEREAREIIAQATEREAGIDIRWVWPGVSSGPDAPVAPADLLAPLGRNEPVVQRLGDGDGALYAYVPVDLPGGRRGAIEVSDPLADEQGYVRRSILTAVTSAAILVVFSAILAWFLGLRLIGWPVRALVEQAGRIGRGDLSPGTGHHGSDELGELAREMNVMCDHLREARDSLEAETRARLDAVGQLRHAERLATIGTLASGLAHELGTPLNVVSGHAQLIREGKDGASLVAHADVITRQCERMEYIVRQLLDFARAQATPAGTFVDFEQSVDEALGMLRPLARRHGVELGVAVEPGLRVRIGREQLQQLLVNLVINAVQATLEGGPVEVRARRVIVPAGRGVAGGEFVALTVRDHGVGMAPDTIERVFEPFFTTKGVGEGTGLGLAVAYGIVKEQGGWIDVSSALGKGSCFTVHLPLEQPE